MQFCLQLVSPPSPKTLDSRKKRNYFVITLNQEEK